MDFPLRHRRNKPLVLLTLGLFVAACGSSGHGASPGITETVYVTNDNNTITEYAAGARGNAAPKAVIGGSNTQLDAPAGIAIDSTGNIYVVNTNSNSLNVYAAGSQGNVAPTVTIGGGNTGLDGPEGLALDAAGNLYVANTKCRLDYGVCRPEQRQRVANRDNLGLSNRSERTGGLGS